MVTNIKQNIEGLKNVNALNLDLILIYIFSQKLDPSTRKAFDYDLGTNKRPNLNLFFEFLDKRCVIAERSVIPDLNKSEVKKIQKPSHYVHLSQNLPSDTSNNDNANVSRPIIQANDNNNFSNFHNKKCIYCNLKGHSVYKCQKFQYLSIFDKNNFVKNKKLCNNCLAYNHLNSECTSKGCFLCGKKHHTSLHVDYIPITTIIILIDFLLIQIPLQDILLRF